METRRNKKIFKVVRRHQNGFLKKIVRKKVGSYRKKGSVLVEFLMAVPVFFLILWGIINIMVYLLSLNQLNEAAYESARTVAVEMRGIEGQIDPTQHVSGIPTQIDRVTSNSSFIRINSDGHEAKYAYTKPECRTLFDNKEKNIVCAYVETYSSSGKNHEQIVVRIKSEFDVIGEFVPGMDNIVKLQARAVVQKELPGRYNYAQP